MGRPPELVIKNIRVKPETIPNDGAGSAQVEAFVFTPNDNAQIQQVVLELESVKGLTPLNMEFIPEAGVSSTRDGLYRGSFQVPLLTDPENYELLIVARDSAGQYGRSPAQVRIEYKNPGYASRISHPDNRVALDRTGKASPLSARGLRMLSDGREAMQTRIEMVESAKKQINLQTYTMVAEGMCGELLNRIYRKASEGVEVNIILNMSSQIAVSPMTALQLGLKRVGRDLHELADEVERTLEGSQGLVKMIQDVKGLFSRLGIGPEGVNVIMADEVAILGEGARGRGRRSKKWLEKMAHDRDELSRERERRAWEWKFRGPAGLPALPLLSFAVHEKILVVDGVRAVVGGRNLEDRYFTHWIDRDVYFEGPAAHAVNLGFLHTWRAFSKNLKRDVEPLSPGPDGVEAGASSGPRFVQSRPWEEEYATLEHLVTVLQMARTRVYMSSQYIVLPDCLLRDAILDAARRGLDVRILTNSLETIKDLGFSGGYFLTLNYLDEILEAGAKVYEVNGPRGNEPPAYLHSKEFLVDGEWAAIGSFNLSIRSAYIESENLATVMDPAVVGDQEALFLDLVRTRATEITASYLKELKDRYRPRISMARRLELFC